MMYVQEIAASRYVELCLGVVVSLYFTRTRFLKTSLTTFSTHDSQFTHDILAASLSLTATDQIVSAVAVYLLAPSIPYLFHEEDSRVCT
jgi:hypothetical protein